MNVSGMGSSNAAMMQKMQSQMFGKADKDGSGGLSKAEFKGLLADAPNGMGATQDIDKTFGKLDADADGSLSTAELDKGAKDAMEGFQSTMAMFSAAGASGDGDTQKSGTSGSAGSSDDLIKQLLAQLQTKYSSAASATETNPLSMFA